MTRKIIIGIGIACWLAAMGFAVAIAHGQCVGGVCYQQPRSTYGPPQLEAPQGSGREYISAAEYKRYGCMVRIKTRDKDGNVSGGSGVVTVYNGQPVVLTSYHVVQDTSSNTIYIIDLFGTTHSGKYIGYNKTWDLAVIKAPPALVKYAVPLQERKVQLKERVGMYGFGGPMQRLARGVGYITGYGAPSFNGAPQDWAYANYPYSYNGDSGGAVIDTQGRLAGVRWGGDKTASIFVTVPRVRNILQSLGICRAPQQQKPQLILQPVQAQRPPPLPTEPTVERTMEELSVDMSGVNSALDKQAEAMTQLSRSVSAYIDMQTRMLQQQQTEQRAQRTEQTWAPVAGTAVQGFTQTEGSLLDKGKGAVASVIESPAAQGAATSALSSLLLLIPGIGVPLALGARLLLPYFMSAGAKIIARKLRSNEKTEYGDVVREGMDVTDKQRARENGAPADG